MSGNGYNGSIINYGHPEAIGTGKAIKDARESHQKALEQYRGKTLRDLEAVMESFGGAVGRNYRGKI